MMRLPIIVIRPEPGATASAALFEAAGFPVIVHPLFVVEPVDWSRDGLADYDALLIGSANAIRHGRIERGNLGDMPVYAVGKTSAQVALDAGLTVAARGRGGIEKLLPMLVHDGRERILRLAGEDHIAIAAPHGTVIDTRIVYRSRALSMPDALTGALANPAIVLLHSAGATRHFAEQCATHDIDRDYIHIAAFAPAVAQAAGTGWASVQSAETPDDKALLALTKRLCQTLAKGR